MVIVIADLPEGTGHTSRLRTLTQAFRDLGHKIRIWNEHALSNTPGQLAHGMLGDVEFEYVLGTVQRSYGFGATMLKLRAVGTILRKASRLHQAKPIDLIILNSLSAYDIVPITVWAWAHGVRTLQCYEDERMEIVSKERLGLARRTFGLNSWLADRWCSRLADAVIVISRYLKRKYDSLTGDPIKVHIVPTIIDVDEWRAPDEESTDCPKLLYSGSFAEHNEIEKVIDALALLTQRGLRFRLLILGADFATPRVKALQMQIAQHGLTDHVELRGYMPLDAVKAEVFSSNILLALRRDSQWSQSGQSTKLSEFLASGRLVITNAVGDNAVYLKDKESALVLPATLDLKDITDALEAAILSPELRRAIGAAGRRAAKQYFDRSVASESVARILHQLIA